MKGKPHMKNLASLQLNDVTGGVATFTATFTGKQLPQRYYLWLSLNDILGAGDENPDAFQPINKWAQPDGRTSTVSIPVVAGHSYEAFVSLFPDVWTSVSGDPIEFTG